MTIDEKRKQKATALEQSQGRPPRSFSQACSWFLARPLRTERRNWWLFFILWNSPTALLVLRFAATRQAPTPADSTLGFAFGLYMVVLTSLGFHGYLGKRTPWPQLGAQDTRMLFELANRLVERRESLRIQWISALTALHAGIFGLVWWVYQHDEPPSDFGKGIQAAAFTALAVVTLAGAASMFASSRAAENALELVRRGGNGETVRFVARKVLSHGAWGFADLVILEALGLLAAFWTLIAYGTWKLVG